MFLTSASLFEIHETKSSVEKEVHESSSKTIQSLFDDSRELKISLVSFAMISFGLPDFTGLRRSITASLPSRLRL